MNQGERQNNDDPLTGSPRTFAFGPFLLVPERQLLARDGVPVRIGGRALDLLTALVERPGELISKAELIAYAWPSTFVDEANLKVNMGSLRRVLDEGSQGGSYIATVIGRGYRFAAPVVREGRSDPAPANPTPARKDNLPTATTSIIGRSDEIASIRADIDAARLVSIVGPGGVGKTTVALAVAERCLGQFEDGIWLVDLATSRDPALVANAIAAAVGFKSPASEALEALCEFLRERRLLLVLDNCEHLIEAAAVCASRILSAAPGVKILGTSRETLAVRGERVRRLPALAAPPPSLAVNAAEALAYPAVRLFVERAADKLESFSFSDVEAAPVSELCRRLDGLALAIELAAARIDAFGVSGLLAQLDDRSRVLTGRRSDPERHRTLEATLDWSYGLLTTAEATLLRAVSVFAGLFDIDDASAVSGLTSGTAAEVLTQLAAKSLLAIDIGGDVIAYRLLETTRAYCRDQLARGQAEDHDVRLRHATRTCAILERAKAERLQRPAPAWGAAYGRVLDDLRSALVWARHEAADRALPVRLTVSGLLLWDHFSLTDESRLHAAEAVADLEAAGLVGSAQDMQLNLGLGASIMYTQGQKPEALKAIRRALEIAEQTGDTDYRLRCLMTLSIFEMFSGQVRDGKRSLDAFAAIAAVEEPSILVASEIHHGVGELMLGELSQARRRFEAIRQRDSRNASAASLRYILDPYAQAGGILCQVQWLLGLPDSARATAEGCLEAGQRSGHHLTLNNALSITCPVFFWAGRYEAAEQCVTRLEEHFRQHRIVTRLPVASFYRAALALARDGGSDEVVGALGRAVEIFRQTNQRVRLPYYMSVQADALVQVGRLDEAQSVIRQALEIADAQEEGWCLAEVMRVQALVLKAGGDQDEAERWLGLSMAAAETFDTLSWRLRAAVDLARIRRDRADPIGAGDVLGPVLDLFGEGLASRDVAIARDLLAGLELSAPGARGAFAEAGDRRLAAGRC